MRQCRFHSFFHQWQNLLFELFSCTYLASIYNRKVSKIRKRNIKIMHLSFFPLLNYIWTFFLYHNMYFNELNFTNFQCIFKYTFLVIFLCNKTSFFCFVPIFFLFNGTVLAQCIDSMLVKCLITKFLRYYRR